MKFSDVRRNKGYKTLRTATIRSAIRVESWSLVRRAENRDIHSVTSGAAVLEIKFTTRYFSKVYVGDNEHMAFYLHHFWRFISAMFVKHDVSLVVLIV